MNFDMNMLSTLMQMFGGIRPMQTGQSATDQDPREAAQSCSYAQKKDASSREYASSFQTEFARNNGIGEKINLNFDGNANKNGFGYNEQTAKTQNATGAQDSTGNLFQNMAAQNPMFSLLQMLQGSKGSDMSSAIMPLLMNMLSPKNAKNAAEPENDTVLHSDDKNASKNNSPSNKPNVSQKQQETADNDQSKNENESDKTDAPPKQKIIKKTQADIFKPIAFAGYELLSALCKLYIMSRHR